MTRRDLAGEFRGLWGGAYLWDDDDAIKFINKHRDTIAAALERCEADDALREVSKITMQAFWNTAPEGVPCDERKRIRIEANDAYRVVSERHEAALAAYREAREREGG